MPGVRIVDITDPMSPTDLAYQPLVTRWSTALAVAGDYLYVGERSEPYAPTGVRVFDVHDPTDPTEVALVPLPQAHARSITADGQHVFVALDRGRAGELRIMDSSDPSAMDEVSAQVGAHVPDGSVWYVEVDAGKAYAAVRDIEGGHSLLRVLDVSHPAEPDVLGDYALSNDPDTGKPPSIHDMAVSGTEVYTLLTQRIHAPYPGLYTDAKRYLWAVNFSDPLTPVKLADLQLPNGPSPTGLVVLNDYAYIAASDLGLYVVEIHR